LPDADRLGMTTPLNDLTIASTLQEERAGVKLRMADA